ncbi:MAG TPA: acetate--CoA ligase [Alphaproteobacteria bacterium]|nr:acetate--CoA ligase [Alphaproteobacteria bacterium]
MIKDFYQQPAEFRSNNNINPVTYKALYDHSINNNDEFWANMANKQVSWFKKWDKVSNCDFTEGKVRWFENAELNVSYNCIDRHLEKYADKTAIIFEPNDPKDESMHISYQQLHDEVCQVANTLKAMGIKKGDRVCLYMPMTHQATYVMLACARIGAIHSVVFAGFSADALKTRIINADAKLVVTCNEGLRGNKTIPLKQTVDDAVKDLNDVQTLVFQHTDADVNMKEGRDFFYEDISKDMPTQCLPESMKATDTLFILYTSGSTGTPKGLEHSTGGYLVYASATHKFSFDHQEDDVFWCTADVGWVTGHSYAVYAPLCNGGTTLIYEGVPNYPDNTRLWQVIDKHKVNVLYTAPTIIRSLSAAGDHLLDDYKLDSLRILGSVGEPISPQSWQWLFDKVGKGRCPIVDTWWQTETGGHMMAPLPGSGMMKPGAATSPLFGIKPVVMTASGQRQKIEHGKATEGVLCIENSWPGQAKGIWNDKERFKKAYFSDYEGMYFTGDGCKVDEEGVVWITGRVDDVINVSGHRMGTAEIEAALLSHNDVAEVAVIGFPHELKGEGIYAYVTLHDNIEESEDLKKELINHVRKEIGAIATLDALQWTHDLPKTRSGKIMRRILRKIAHNDYSNLGDTSTLIDPSVVNKLINRRITVEAHRSR